MNDVSTLTISLPAAVAACCGIVSALIGVILYAHGTFAKKADLDKLDEETHTRHDRAEDEVKAVKMTMNGIDTNVAFIRGLLEGKRHAQKRSKPSHG